MKIFQIIRLKKERIEFTYCFLISCLIAYFSHMPHSGAQKNSIGDLKGTEERRQRSQDEIVVKKLIKLIEESQSSNDVEIITKNIKDLLSIEEKQYYDQIVVRALKPISNIKWKTLKIVATYQSMITQELGKAAFAIKEVKKSPNLSSNVKDEMNSLIKSILSNSSKRNEIIQQNENHLNDSNLNENDQSMIDQLYSKLVKLAAINGLTLDSQLVFEYFRQAKTPHDIVILSWILAPNIFKDEILIKNSDFINQFLDEALLLSNIPFSEIHLVNGPMIAANRIIGLQHILLKSDKDLIDESEHIYRIHDRFYKDIKLWKLIQDGLSLGAIKNSNVENFNLTLRTSEDRLIDFINRGIQSNSLNAQFFKTLWENEKDREVLLNFIKNRWQLLSDLFMKTFSREDNRISEKTLYNNSTIIKMILQSPEIKNKFIENFYVYDQKIEKIEIKNVENSDLKKTQTLNSNFDQCHLIRNSKTEIFQEDLNEPLKFVLKELLNVNYFLDQVKSELSDEGSNNRSIHLRKAQYLMQILTILIDPLFSWNYLCLKAEIQSVSSKIELLFSEKNKKHEKILQDLTGSFREIEDILNTKLK